MWIIPAAQLVLCLQVNPSVLGHLSHPRTRGELLESVTVGVWGGGGVGWGGYKSLEVQWEQSS